MNEVKYLLLHRVKHVQITATVLVAMCPLTALLGPGLQGVWIILFLLTVRRVLKVNTAMESKILKIVQRDSTVLEELQTPTSI